jgi:hypothetical protein
MLDPSHFLVPAIPERPDFTAVVPASVADPHGEACEQIVDGSRGQAAD